MNKLDAFNVLRELNAPIHLITHVKLVGEAATQLVETLNKIGLDFDSDFVEVGVVLHDVGKIINPNEMYQKGSMHEIDGQQLLLDRGITSKIARVCVSHGQWESMDCSLEELLIALSDTLWKGKRVQNLEEEVVKSISSKLKIDYWSNFTLLDNCFETIASKADDRLSRSITAKNKIQNIGKPST